MEISAITITLLNAYRHIEKECKAIDEFMTNYAVSSSKRNIFKTVDKIIACTNDKIALINAKVIVDKMGYSTALRQVYCEKKRPLRGRIHENAEKQIEKFNTLLFDQYTAVQLFDMISDSKFLMKLYKEYSRREKKALNDIKGKQ